jgi:glycosyltransferase involved in cell wall biosynthesis
MPEPTNRQLVIVAARDEADRIAATVAALRAALPSAEVWVADDGSIDGTADAAMAAGARVVRRGKPHGKGGNMTAATTAALDGVPADASGIALVCDGDLGASAATLAGLVEAVTDDRCDLAIAAFSRRVGGGFGIALRFARWAIRNRSGYEAGAPISGQRAMRIEVLRAVMPFASGYGMEVGMTIDAVRAGYRVAEIELDLEHRATGRTLGGFTHRAAQLKDFMRAWLERRA